MVMTAMLRAENPFPLELPTAQRSSYFSAWYDAISARYRGDIEKRYDSAMSASRAARQIIDAVHKGQSKAISGTNWGSGKIWVGSMAWIFRWIWPLLSTSRQDRINGDLLHVEILTAK